jgi:hypothetical protein
MSTEVKQELRKLLQKMAGKYLHYVKNIFFIEVIKDFLNRNE